MYMLLVWGRYVEDPTSTKDKTNLYVFYVGVNLILQTNFVGLS